MREGGRAHGVAAGLAEDEGQHAAVHRVDLVVRGLKAEPAVADDLRRDTLEHLRGGLRIDRQREVAVRVDVDEARSHDEPGGIEYLVGLQRRVADLGDPVVLQQEVAPVRRCPGAIEEPRAGDEHASCHLEPL